MGLVEVFLVFRWVLRWFTPVAWVLVILWGILRFAALIPFEVVLWGWTAVFFILLFVALSLLARTSKNRYWETVIVGFVLYGVITIIIMILFVLSIAALATGIHFVSVALGFPLDWWLIWTVCFLIISIETEVYLRRKLQVKLEFQLWRYH